MPPQEILKITLSEIEFESIFSDLSPFNAPVDTSTQTSQNVLSAYLSTYVCNYVRMRSYLEESR